MDERKKGWAARRRSLDFLVNRGLVAMGAELLQFNPLGGVAAVLLGGVTRHPRTAFGGIGPAFRALEGDHDPDALVFGHKDVAPLLTCGVTIHEHNRLGACNR